MSDNSPTDDSAGRITRVLDAIGAHETDGIWDQRVELSFDLADATDGRYTVIREIGTGGMGRVLLARDDELQRDVAVKVLDFAGAEEDDPLVSKFLREARITAGLDHPGIVPVYDLGRTPDRRHFFIMRVVAGTTLRELLDRARRADLNRVHYISHLLGIMVRVCQAVGYAHHKGIAHLDLKPSNIMEGPFGEVMVMDWGVAQELDERLPLGDPPDDGDAAVREAESHIIGTPGFMAPEQYNGESGDLTPAADVFALGAILYEVLTGEKPFPGETFAQIQNAVTQRRMRPIHEVVKRSGQGRVPQEVIAICDKALSLDPRQRYRTAHELGLDLRAYIEHRAVSAFRGGIGTRFRRWCRRHRGAAATLLVLVVFGITMGSALVTGVVSQHQYLSILRQQVDNRRADYQESCRQADWLRRHLNRLPTDAAEKRRETAQQLAQFHTRRHLTAQQLRQALAALFAAQRDNLDPDLTRELRRLWLDEMEAALWDGDAEYVRRSYEHMQEERGTVPWWNWEPDEFARVEQLHDWLREQAARPAARQTGSTLPQPGPPTTTQVPEE